MDAGDIEIWSCEIKIRSFIIIVFFIWISESIDEALDYFVIPDCLQTLYYLLCFSAFPYFLPAFYIYITGYALSHNFFIINSRCLKLL